MGSEAEAMQAWSSGKLGKSENLLKSEEKNNHDSVNIYFHLITKT